MRLKAAFLLGVLLAGSAEAQTLTIAPLTEAPANRIQLDLAPIGRVWRSEDFKTAAYSWPLSGVNSQFYGRTLVIRLSDASGRLSLSLDGKPLTELVHPGDVTVTISDIPDAGPVTSHTIDILKYNETQHSAGHILGLYADSPGYDLVATTPILDVIGDSWTAGYGVLSDSRLCSPDKLDATTDARPTWGVSLAEDLDMTLRMEAYSGIGIVRNYGGSEPGRTMPAIYAQDAFADLAPGASQAPWQPALVVISLGGNDFETSLHDGETWQTRDELRADFVTGYEAFLRNLRQRYPKAGLVMMNYGEKEVVAATATIIAQLNSEGETHIATYTASGPFEQTGCDWHLNINDYNKIADGMIAWLRQHPDLWQGS